MDQRTRAFLVGAMGADGAQAVVRAAQKEPGLGSVLALRAALAWCSVQAQVQVPAQVPGTTKDFSLRKTDVGYDGSIGGRAFVSQPLVRVAAMVSDAVGEPGCAAPRVRGESLRKLGKAIDLLVQSHHSTALQKADQEPPQRPSAPRNEDSGYQLRVQKHLSGGGVTVLAHRGGKQVACAILDRRDDHLAPAAHELLVREPALLQRMHALASRVAGLPVREAPAQKTAKTDEIVPLGKNQDWQEQTYGDEHANYRVGDLHAHAQRYPVQQVPVEHLRHIIETTDSDEPYGSPEFHARAMASDTKHPVLLIRYPHGLENADGLHRIYKHLQQGAKTVPARVIPHESLAQVPTLDDVQKADGKVAQAPAQMPGQPLAPQMPSRAPQGATAASPKPKGTAVKPQAQPKVGV